MKDGSRLYHLADVRNLASIFSHGLQSTARLLHLTGVPPSEHDGMLRRHRPAGVELPGGVHVRDQRPMPPRLLAPALTSGLEPADWYALVNSFVYFWLDRGRLERHRRAYSGPQRVLVFDANRLLSEFADRAFVSPINIGNARRRAALRDRRTIVPVQTWQASGWSELRAAAARRGPPAEILIADIVPAHAPYFIGVEHDPADSA